MNYSAISRTPTIRRLSLLTFLSAVGGALFVPFMIAGSEVTSQRNVLYLWTLSPLVCAVVGALCAWGGLIAADRAELPMPILRAWELHQPQDRSKWSRTLLLPMIGGVLFAVITLVCEEVVGVPKNPGNLAARLLTIPFAAVVAEIIAHLLILSALALWLKKRWLAILLSGVAYSVILRDFLFEDRLISPVEDHLTGSLAEPKATILTRPSSCWQVFVL